MCTPARPAERTPSSAPGPGPSRSRPSSPGRGSARSRALTFPCRWSTSREADDPPPTGPPRDRHGHRAAGRLRRLGSAAGRPSGSRCSSLRRPPPARGRPRAASRGSGSAGAGRAAGGADRRRVAARRGPSDQARRGRPGPIGRIGVANPAVGTIMRHRAMAGGTGQRSPAIAVLTSSSPSSRAASPATGRSARSWGRGRPRGRRTRRCGARSRTRGGARPATG